jgi:AraC-like DNA-binding protein
MPSEIQDRFRYLPITERSERWGLYLTGCGQISVPAHGQHPPGGHPGVYSFQWNRGRVLPEFQAVYLIEGQGAFESTPSDRRKLAAGDVFLLFPGVWHRYRPVSGTCWQTRWIGFNGTLPNTWLENGLLNSDEPVLHLGPRPELVEAYQRVMDLAFDDPTGNPLRLAAEAMQVLALILGPTQPEAAQPSSRPFTELILDRFVAEATRLIWTAGQHAMTVSDVVAHFPVTRRSLERRFQRTLGHTILDEIIRCRLERAKRLLVETDQPLKAVALAAGFSGTQHMSKVFHRAEGVAPARYRRDHTRTGEQVSR